MTELACSMEPSGRELDPLAGVEAAIKEKVGTLAPTPSQIPHSRKLCSTTTCHRGRLSQPGTKATRAEGRWKEVLESQPGSFTVALWGIHSIYSDRHPTDST